MKFLIYCRGICYHSSRFDGYFATVERLPEMLEIFDWYSKIFLTVYDTREKLRKGDQPEEQIYVEGTYIPISFMLGGAQFEAGRLAFDWNFTITRNSTDNIRRLGLVTLHTAHTSY